MKERPILFKGEMVRAILAGRKTQTRRVVKLPKNHVWGEFFDGQICPENDLSSLGYPIDELRCPYGQPGDRFFVRESFSGPYCMSEVDGLPAMPPSQWPIDTPIWYWADGEPTHGDWTKPKPSIHMTRWASRITLEITGMRVERLQDISEADAKAEGVEPPECCYAHYHGFSKLWQSINGPSSWDENPWVWCIEFKRV